MVDPQAQAVKWIKHMESKQGLSVIDLQTPDYMKIIEQCVLYGRPCLCQNLKEELDPSLNPILMKSIKKIGRALVLCFQQIPFLMFKAALM